MTPLVQEYTEESFEKSVSFSVIEFIKIYKEKSIIVISRIVFYNSKKMRSIL